MTLAQNKISNKKIPKLVEHPLTRITRERLEKEAKIIQDKKDTTKVKKIEKQRQAEIIRPYLEKLHTQIYEKNIQEFWTFTDRKSFKKFYGKIAEVRKFLKSDIHRFQNRKIAYFAIAFHNKEKETTMHRVNDIWLTVTFTVYHLDDKCNMNNSLHPATGGNIVWKTEDFALTKFSLSLMQNILYAVSDEIALYTSIIGFQISYVLKDLKKKRLDLYTCCKPLANI